MKYMKHCSVKHCAPSAALLALLSLAPAAGHAEFALNFKPQPTHLSDPEWLAFNCNRPSAMGDFEDCDKNDLFRDNNGRDSTPFLFERVVDSATGQQYYHTIIGLPGDDFVQEAYIKILRYMNKDSGGFTTTPQREIDDLGPISDSLGNWRSIENNRNNAYAPLGPASFSGSGTANPRSTQFRQIINDSGLYQEITKASFDKKHRIVENLDTAEISHQFEMDMTNSTYGQDNIAGVMRKNQQVVTQGGFSSAFDINNTSVFDKSDVNVNGGKYLYAQKYTTTLSGGPFENEYAGEGAGYNIWGVDWWSYRDPDQNPSCSASKDDGDKGWAIKPRCHLYSGSPKD
jgi:hypothetical protein